VWCAGAPESGARQGGADARQAHDPDTEEAARGGGDQLAGDRDDRRRAPDPPPVPPRAATQRVPVHGRTQGDWNHQTATAPTTVLHPIIHDNWR